jgi:hypothetical protein
MFINQDTLIANTTTTDTNSTGQTIEDNNIIYFAIGMFAAIIIAVLLIRYYTRNPTEQVKTQKYRRQSSEISHTFQGFKITDNKDEGKSRVTTEECNIYKHEKYKYEKRIHTFPGFEITDNQIKSTEITIKITESKTNGKISEKQLIMQQDQHSSVVDLSKIPMGQLTNIEIINLIKSSDPEIINLIKGNEFYSNLFMICENQIHQIGKYTKPTQINTITMSDRINIKLLNDNKAEISHKYNKNVSPFIFEDHKISKLFIETTNDPTQYLNLQSEIKSKVKEIADKLGLEPQELKTHISSGDLAALQNKTQNLTIAQFISNINSPLNMIGFILEEELKSGDAHIENLSDLFTETIYKNSTISIEYYALKNALYNKLNDIYESKSSSMSEEYKTKFKSMIKPILIIDGLTTQNENIIKDIAQFTSNHTSDQNSRMYAYKTLIKIATNEWPNAPLKHTNPINTIDYNLDIFKRILDKAPYDNYDSWSEGGRHNILQAAKIIIIGLINGNLLDVYTKIENEIKLIFDAFEAHQKDKSIPYTGNQGMPPWNKIASHVKNLLDNQNIESLQNNFNHITQTTLNELKSKVNPKYIGLTSDRMIEILKSPELSKEHNL